MRGYIVVTGSIDLRQRCFVDLCARCGVRSVISAKGHSGFTENGVGTSMLHVYAITYTELFNSAIHHLASCAALGTAASLSLKGS